MMASDSDVVRSSQRVRDANGLCVRATDLGIELSWRSAGEDDALRAYNLLRLMAGKAQAMETSGWRRNLETP